MDNRLTRAAADGERGSANVGADGAPAGWLARLDAGQNENGQQATADQAALRRLDALVGTWELTAQFPGDPPTVFSGAQTTFEWMPGGHLLVQRTDLPEDGPPSSLTVITYDEDTAAFRQHYFDSRGVVRLTGAWEKRVRDSWDHDFALTYSRRPTAS